MNPAEPDTNEGFYWHVHHDVLMEWCFDAVGRQAYIRAEKPASEVELRLRLMQPVRGQLPEVVVKARAEYEKARAEYDKAEAGYEKAQAGYDKAWAGYEKARAGCDKAWAGYEKAQAGYDKARAGCDKARAKYNKAISHHQVEIEALHAQECPNCPWNGSIIFPKRTG